ncbi:glycosyltransferase [Nocardioides sp. zg-1228]|uniref:glycosyltransferase n=1 Tax=Nocardioides sp. zg-1228 TaxID=2763008 RepID=UPI0016425724|nr:glycosyltransferase [Nocardioides sp. zg-1228]MBC2931652.1 glycosyltransferase [Nocardioides sp. zg-1228]QSF57243.1 glycosyltransferase [Nocardioides sp. zg-1228]
MTSAVVVPLFDPSAEVVSRLVDLARHRPVVAVDDSPEVTDRSVLAQLAHQGVVVLRHERNRGIAAALNTGIAHVAKNDLITAILTLDQDSFASLAYVAAAEALLSNAHLGLVYPHMLDAEPQVGAWRNGLWEALEPMQSGWLLKTAAWRDVGPFREELVIDCVDTDYYFRLLDRGWRAQAVQGMSIDHQLGTPGSFLGLFTYRQHPPFRIYFIVRNRIITARLHGRRHRSWALRSLGRTLKDVVKTLVVGGQRAQTLGAVARAVRDGVGAQTDMGRGTRRVRHGGLGGRTWRS